MSVVSAESGEKTLRQEIASAFAVQSACADCCGIPVKVEVFADISMKDESERKLKIYLVR
jgi:hypothetical protein